LTDSDPPPRWWLWQTRSRAARSRNGPSAYTKRAKWRDQHGVKEQFGTASFAGKYVVFNIAGNKYRSVTEINYRTQNVFIRWIVTHEEYDDLDLKG
jgi:mRNA interferase HigB